MKISEEREEDDVERRVSQQHQTFEIDGQLTTDNKVRRGCECVFSSLKDDSSKVALVYGQMNEPPGARARVALTGLTVAEYFRDQEGQDVLLFIDNIFRFTQAGSEVSALLGRIPSAVGYQPTLATDMGAMQERITTTKKGSITSVQAIYVPADDLTDPAPATTFAHLDATTVLSRGIAELGIYPAVDPLDSTSRILDPNTVGEEHYETARAVQKILQDYKSLQDIIAILEEVFGDGSLFSPLLFGKFFDPADAFPLWDFESHTLLPIGGKVDWDETDVLYTLKSELPRGGIGVGGDGYELEICVESGKVVEMSRQMRESAKDWRKDKWWEYGHVRRLELPTNADWKRAEAYYVAEGNVISLEIKIPKNTSESNTTTTSTN